MCIVSNVLLLSSDAVIVRAREAILLKRYAMVLFNVCSAVMFSLSEPSELLFLLVLLPLRLELW